MSDYLTEDECKVLLKSVASSQRSYSREEVARLLDTIRHLRTEVTFHSHERVEAEQRVIDLESRLVASGQPIQGTR